MNVDRVLAEISHATTHTDENRLTAALYELGTITMYLGEYGADMLTSLLRMLQTDQARGWEPSWLIWKHFEENWDLISESSRTTLRLAVEAEFGRSAHWMWSFTIAILLAECFTDAAAMDALIRFRQKSAPRARAVLPDAIRNLSGRTTIDAVRQKGRRELELLTQDQHVDVRQEAALALARWNSTFSWHESLLLRKEQWVFVLVQPPPWIDTNGINQALATLSRGESVALVNIEFHKDWAVYKVRLDDGRPAMAAHRGALGRDGHGRQRLVSHEKLREQQRDRHRHTMRLKLVELCVEFEANDCLPMLRSVSAQKDTAAVHNNSVVRGMPFGRRVHSVVVCGSQ